MMIAHCTQPKCLIEHFNKYSKEWQNVPNTFKNGKGWVDGRKSQKEKKHTHTKTMVE